MKDVATAAGVHYSTVSRALNPATRDLVKPLDLAYRSVTSRDLAALQMHLAVRRKRRDGALNVTDIFDYLSAWFHGCP